MQTSTEPLNGQNFLSEDFWTRFKIGVNFWWIRRTRMEKNFTIWGTVTIIVFIIISLVATSAGNYGVRSSKVYEPKNFDGSFIGDPLNNVKVVKNEQLENFISQQLMKNVDRSKIKQHLRTITREYHPAGSPENMRVVKYIADQWQNFGLDKVEVEPYNVLLSYPDYDNPNTVYVRLDDGNGPNENWKLISKGISHPKGPPEAQNEQKDQRAWVWWNAYAKNGSAEGTIIYARFCTEDDFEAIDPLVESYKGKIILCRFGSGWRGSKVYEAEIRNASGVILYSDPQDYGPPESESPDFFYPRSIYMPPHAVQRGSLYQRDGDPQTPFYPAKNYTYRWYTESDLRSQSITPNIPVLPIGYKEALTIFQSMKGGVEMPFPSFWGSLKTKYYLNTTTVFKINVNSNTTHRTIKNVIGYIYGKSEPDRLVFIGNHIDAWTFGAQDPNSGTAIGLELSRVFMQTINETGWRPRRTLVFCGWDAEEFGLIGSYEWVEQKTNLLRSRAVALINVDVGVKGNQTLSVQSVPLLYRTFVKASKKVHNPNAAEVKLGRPTVYDSWLHYKNKTLLFNDPTLPYMITPAGGSDHKSFLTYMGVPVGFHTYDRQENPNNYPLYHTLYEVAWTMENLVDPNYYVSEAMVRVTGEILRDLSDSVVIPFNVSDYGSLLNQLVSKMEEDLRQTPDIQKIVDHFDDVISSLKDASKRFWHQAGHFQKLVDQINRGSPASLLTVEALNSRLVTLERCFVDPQGLPERMNQRHVIFGSSMLNNYGSSVFNGVYDSLRNFGRLNQSKQKREYWRKQVNLQITAVHYAIESAIENLQFTRLS